MIRCTSYLTGFAAVYVAFALTACSGLPDMGAAREADRQKDYTTALNHYQKLAEFGLPVAQVQLGKYYLQGKGVEADPVKALVWFERAEKAGQGERVLQDINTAKTEAGRLALNGKSPSVSTLQGIAFLKEAGAAGDERALFELGNAYEKGNGVSKNIPLALDYYERAGGLGYGRADYNRAMIYEKGKLVQQDMDLALSLYQKAAANNYTRANSRLAQLSEKNAE